MSQMKGHLTRRERHALSLIEQHITEHGVSPTAQELADAMCIQSRGVAHRYMKKLVDAGYLTNQPKRHRNLSRLSAANMPPVLGQIAAGAPIQAINEPVFENWADQFVSRQCYALRVRGDSMCEVGILDSDTIICRATQTAQPGEIVVVLIDGADVTLKRWQPSTCGTQVTLQAENKDMPSLTYATERLQVQGVYVGLLRSVI